jgi:hypothetical protein
MMPTVWPTAADLRWQIENGQELEFSQRFAELTAGKDYFLVSPLDELDSQPDLAAELDRYPLVYTAENIRVFDLRAAPQP